MKICGIINKNKTWVDNYLLNRQQCNVVNGSNSKQLNVTCGVPQGSNLELLLFLIYINDLSHVITITSMYLYVNTVVLSTDKCINSCTDNMQWDLVTC